MDFSNESIISYQNRYVLPFEMGVPDIKVRRWLADFWPYSFLFAGFYVAFIYGLQMQMRKRKPFELRRPLALWNGLLAVFSVCGTLRTSEEFFHTLFVNGFYNSICSPMDTTTVVAHWYLFFATSKIAELGDTVFLVLRKRPLTFLHCYHHASVMIYTFNAGAENLASGRWLMTMNFIAHSFMYLYYTAMSSGIKVSRSLAKFVTVIQITQMFIGLGISASVYVTKYYIRLPCGQSITNLQLTTFIYSSYAVLFLHYFYRTYSSSKPKTLKAE